MSKIMGLLAAALLAGWAGRTGRAYRSVLLHLRLARRINPELSPVAGGVQSG